MPHIGNAYHSDGSTTRLHLIRDGAFGIGDMAEYQMDVATQRYYATQNAEAARLGGLMGLFLRFLVRFVLLGVVSTFPLYTRIFMNRGVVIIHMKRSSRLLVLSVAAVALAWMVPTGLSLANRDQIISDVFEFVKPLGLFSLVALGIGLVQIAISNFYSEKTYGNGYGLLNIIALLPGVQPRRSLTIALDGVLSVGLLIAILVSPSTTSSAGSLIGSLVTYVVIIAFLFGYTWYTDNLFNTLQAQAEQEMREQVKQEIPQPAE
jgi:hypothetical protein